MAEMSKTPEEIKKGLECAVDKKCIGKECSYFNEEYACIRMVQVDALALIQQLERDKAWASENYDLIREENKRLEAHILCKIDVIKLLEAQVPKWISVEERLPEKSGRYLVCTSKSSVYYTKFTRHEQGGRFHTDINTHITHWMPMPEPPKEGSNA